LQAVPGFDIATIQRIRPFIKISNTAPLVEVLRNRFFNGEHRLLARTTNILERAKGFQTIANNKVYTGNAAKVFLRYRYQFGHGLQYGFTGEKDAGEPFFKGQQRWGFDFYSGHLFIRDVGKIKTLALGDYTVNFGQGLIQWQGLAFGMGADVMSIKRQGNVLNPYTGAGEYNFHRGAAITVQQNQFSFTTFFSKRKLDANGVVDSLGNVDAISSFQQSGLHRTTSELLDRQIQTQISYGAQMRFQQNRFQANVQTIHYHFSIPFVKSLEPRNLYAWQGKYAANYSANYAYTLNNMHAFGEWAINQNGAMAMVQGLLLSVDAKVDVSLLYRHISPAYQSFNNSAFTQNSLPTNESGLYAGVSIKPITTMKIEGFFDFFRFPWLKYDVNKPSSGSNLGITGYYKPNRKIDAYIRYRTSLREQNAAGLSNITLPGIRPFLQRQIRIQINSKLNADMLFRTRMEFVWVAQKGSATEEGFLWFADVVYKPLMKKYSGNIRMQFFETESYNSRVYAYENDVLYSYSIPVFYDKGTRFYININYDLSKKMSFWVRFAQSFYPNRKTIGSGWDEIAGNRKSEVKLQLQYVW
jgi:hypothetical protein